MQNVVRMRRALSRLRAKQWLAVAYLVVTVYFFLSFVVIPQLLTYRPLKFASGVVVMGLPLAFTLAAVVAAVSGEIAWLRRNTPQIIPGLRNAVRSAWQNRGAYLKRLYIWSGLLPFKRRLLWATHPWFTRLLAYGYASVVACFLSAALFGYDKSSFLRSTVNFTFVTIMTGLGVGLFFIAVDLLNSALELFYGLREKGFFAAMRWAWSAFAAVCDASVKDAAPSDGEAVISGELRIAAGEPQEVTGVVLEPEEEAQAWLH